MMYAVDRYSRKKTVIHNRKYDCKLKGCASPNANTYSHKQSGLVISKVLAISTTFYKNQITSTQSNSHNLHCIFQDKCIALKSYVI